MDMIGKFKDEFIYTCKVCELVEYCKDPTMPTTPEEIPRKNLLEYGSSTKIGY